MDYSSEEISDSEIDDYEEKFYLDLKEGRLRVKYTEKIFRCPFCVGKKKQEYNLKDLLQHASGIGSSNRKAVLKANHRALAKFLMDDLASSAGSSQQLVVVEPSTPSDTLNDDKFVWPWMGIVVNFPTEYKNGKYVGESGNRLKEQLSKFNVLKVRPLWNHDGHSGNCIIDFSKDWSGFKDAMAFEKYFEVDHYGKRDWQGRRPLDSHIYGWVARDDDYNSDGLIGEHLKKNGDLKTVTDLAIEESRKADKLIAYLATEIEVKNKHLDELECKYNETTLALTQIMEERDKLLQAHHEEIQKMQCHAHDHSSRIFDENEKLRSELDAQREELDLMRKQLDKLIGQNDTDKEKLDAERQKNAMKDGLLHLSAMEPKKADENVLKLTEGQKREEDAALKKILQVEKQLDATQKLELEIQQLQEKLQAMKHMGSEEDAAMKLV